MILPNKLFSYNQSVLPKMVLIKKFLQDEDHEVTDLFNELENYFSGVDEFIEAADCLYAIGHIEYDNNRRTLRNVKRD